MKWRGAVRVVGIASGLVLAASNGLSQIASSWRYWDSSDGFIESYTSSLAPNPGGGFWVKHGRIGEVDLLDGYGDKRYADPGKSGKIETAPDGTLWMFSDGYIGRFRNSQWKFYPVEEAMRAGSLRENSRERTIISLYKDPHLQALISIVALNQNYALILLPDCILEFNAGRGSSRAVLVANPEGSGRGSMARFVAIKPGRDGSVYIAGERGLGRLSGRAGGTWTWTAMETPPGPWTSFDEPLDAGREGLFLTATGPSMKAALKYQGGRWSEIRRSKAHLLRAWPGTPGTVWVQEDNELVQISAGREIPVERNGPLSGILLAVNVDKQGAFWISSSQGAARYSPLLWQTPVESPHLDDVISSIVEDRSGNIWFLAPHELIRFDNLKWRSYPLPVGESSYVIFTEGLNVLPDGRIAINVVMPHLLVFDPASGKFDIVKHPSGRNVRMAVSQPDGTLLIETTAHGSAAAPSAGPGAIALERFNGRNFSSFIPPEQVKGSDLRSFRVASDGSVWIGGTRFFGFVRDSRFTSVGAAEGFHDPGAYYIYTDPSGKLIAGGRDGLYERVGSRWRLMRSGLDRVRNVIRSRDGTMWVSSGTGIHRVRDGVWIANGMEEGLPSSVAYKIFEDSRGRLWAGTTRGLSLFHPDADPDPPVAILRQDQNPREAPPGGQVHLAFSGIDKWKFTPASRLLFSWRMDNGQWSPFDEASSVSFDRLPAGSHHFEVRAMDRNGNIGRAAASHGFTVLRPWYGTRGFLWLASCAAALIAFLVNIAVRSYAYRGKLIHELNQKNKLERDRQTILELVARREPLGRILQSIADSVAQNCPGATCIVSRPCAPGLGVFSNPALPDDLLQSLQDADVASAERLMRRQFAGGLPVVPIRSGNGEALGSIALLFDTAGEPFDSGQWLLETFSGLAAAAIENAHLYQQLAHQARHDALTGLPNRLHFEDLLQSAVCEAKATGESMALMYIDLDRFKQVNDTMGHRAGDLFLGQVASRLSSVLSPGATLARIGGDEFTVLIRHGAERNSVEQLAAAMFRAMRAPIRLEGQDLFASASIGISFFPEDGATPSVLQKHADISMYRAKARGRNCMEFFAAETEAEGDTTPVELSML